VQSPARYSQVSLKHLVQQAKNIKGALMTMCITAVNTLHNDNVLKCPGIVDNK